MMLGSPPRDNLTLLSRGLLHRGASMMKRQQERLRPSRDITLQKAVREG